MSRCHLLMPLLAAIVLSACTTYHDTPLFSERHELKPGLSERSDVLDLVGDPEREADVPRHMLDRKVIEQCMAWDQPTLKTLVYSADYLKEGACCNNGVSQETHVYLNAQGKVCASGSWLWNSVEKKWKFTTGQEF